MSILEYLEKNIPPFNEIRIERMILKSCLTYVILIVLFLLFSYIETALGEYYKNLFVILVLLGLYSLVFALVGTSLSFVNGICSLPVLYRCKTESRSKEESTEKISFYRAYEELTNYRQLGLTHKLPPIEEKVEIYRNKIRIKYECWQ